MNKKTKVALLLIAIILLFHFWPHGKHLTSSTHTKVAVANTKITDGNVYWDNLKPDTRTQAQWEYQCNPAWAETIAHNSTPIDSVWCTTPYNNKFDNDSAKPADWKWISRPFHD